MNEDGNSYLNFIKQYQNRILFGSDAMIDRPLEVHNNMQFIIDFLHDQRLAEKIFCSNYLVFHEET